MVEDIVFIILVILAVGAGIWVWRMEVSGAPIVPPQSASKSTDPSADKSSNAENEETA